MAKLLKAKFLGLLLALVILPVGSVFACGCDGSTMYKDVDHQDEDTSQSQ